MQARFGRSLDRVQPVRKHVDARERIVQPTIPLDGGADIADRAVNKTASDRPNPMLIAINAAIMVGHEIIEDRMLEATLTTESV